MKPFSLMRLRRVDSPTDVLRYHSANDLLVEEKFDGFKVLIIKDKFGKIKAYTRRGISFEENIPTIIHALADLPSGTALLGELVYLINKKQSLSGVQSIVNASVEHAIDFQANHNGILKLYVYDIIYYEDKNITKLPLIKRKLLLREIIPTSKIIRIVQSYKFNEYPKIIKNALKAGGEGIIIKPLNSIYVLKPFGENEPFGEWYKYKPSDTEDVLLTSYFFHQKEKKAIFPAYQYKRGKLVEVGKLSGLDGWTQIDFMNRIDKGEKLVVEIEFQEKFPSGKIRSMVFVRDRSREKKI